MITCFHCHQVKDSSLSRSGVLSHCQSCELSYISLGRLLTVSDSTFVMRLWEFVNSCPVWEEGPQCGRCQKQTRRIEFKQTDVGSSQNRSSRRFVQEYSSQGGGFKSQNSDGSNPTHSHSQRNSQSNTSSQFTRSTQEKLYACMSCYLIALKDSTLELFRDTSHHSDKNSKSHPGADSSVLSTVLRESMEILKATADTVGRILGGIGNLLLWGFTESPLRESQMTLLIFLIEAGAFLFQYFFPQIFVKTVGVNGSVIYATLTHTNWFHLGITSYFLFLIGGHFEKTTRQTLGKLGLAVISIFSTWIAFLLGAAMQAPWEIPSLGLSVAIATVLGCMLAWDPAQRYRIFPSHSIVHHTAANARGNDHTASDSGKTHSLQNHAQANQPSATSAPELPLVFLIGVYFILHLGALFGYAFAGLGIGYLFGCYSKAKYKACQLNGFEEHSRPKGVGPKSCSDQILKQSSYALRER